MIGRANLKNMLFTCLFLLYASACPDVSVRTVRPRGYLRQRMSRRVRSGSDLPLIPL